MESSHLVYLLSTDYQEPCLVFVAYIIVMHQVVFSHDRYKTKGPQQTNTFQTIQVTMQLSMQTSLGEDAGPVCE